MQKRSGAVVYFPSALVRYLPRHMPGGRIAGMPRRDHAGRRNGGGEKLVTKLVAQTGVRHEISALTLLQNGRMTVSVAPSV
jgi:hypothetical protein